MKLNNFEKYIKNNMSSAEEHVDIEKLMAGIPPIKPKRKKYPFYIFGGIIVLAGLFYFYNSAFDTTLNSTSISSTNTSLKNNQLFNNQEINTDFSNPTLPNNNSNNDSENLNASQEKSKTDAELVYTQENITISSNAKVNHNESVVVRNNKNKQISSSRVNNNNELLVNQSFIKNNNESLLSFSLSDNNVNFTEEKTKLHDGGISMLNTSLIKSLPIHLEEHTALHTGKIGLPQNVECPDFGSNPWTFEIGTVLGLSKPSKKLRNNTTTVINPAITSRTENEKSLEGLDLEFFISAKRARWPVFLRSGFNYSRWSERMKIDDQYTTIDTVQGVISTTVSQSGDTITYIYGDIYITKEYDVKKDIHYYINRFDIPLSIAYEQRFGSHAIQAELGARMNVTTFAQGRIYNENAEFSELQNNNFFKKITGVSYFGKAHYRYYLSHKYFLGTSIQYQYLPAEFSSNASFSQKYTNFGLGIYAGMRF